MHACVFEECVCKGCQNFIPETTSSPVARGRPCQCHLLPKSWEIGGPKLQSKVLGLASSRAILRWRQGPPASAPHEQIPGCQQPPQAWTGLSVRPEDRLRNCSLSYVGQKNLAVGA